MTDLSARALVKLWEDGELVLFRATHPTDPSLLVLSPAASASAPSALARLQRSCSLRDQLDATWAARPIALVEHQGRPTLISEDPGGELLAQQVGRPWPIAPFLRVAIGIAAALRRLHARGLVHKDIKPANVFARDDGTVWLSGFGITSPSPRERQVPGPPELIAGTLAYMAPEQTGRMNRSIDSRSDLYSLGVTLFELLTGRLPFTAAEPMEWVHCHIAREPASLRCSERGIPQPVGDIVMKLLAKTAEQRYQTAAGVERDLRRCLSEWESTGLVEAFAPGEHDVSDRLHIPEKLYGRDAEIGVLLSTFDEVLATGATQLVLVSGYSGIGKSSVVNELHRVLVPPRGLYASGKFDRYKRDIPYATLAQAFVGLIRHVLGKQEAEIESWRTKLLRAVGPNGQLMTNLVPELELVIGKQPDVPELSAENAQARFQNVVRRFIGVFATPEHPLALFMDDLQWLDTATLALVERLITDPEVKHLLLVGAYRDNEIGQAHALSRTLEKLRADGARTHEIVLSPLGKGDVAALYASALHADVESVRPLAELAHEKTGGNPFFAIQFMSALVDERLLAFDAESSRWRWDIQAIHAKRFTDNVVELMALKLHRLPDATKSALRQLACLGSSASTAELSLVYGVPEAGLHEALAGAVNVGLVSSTAGSYAFLHDRVHEAAYAMVPEGERAAEHLRIGTVLAARVPAAELKDHIFEIVTHLNRGAATAGSQRERDRIASLDLLAAQRAKASTAHAEARAYAALALSLLGPDRWKRCFRLAFDLELLLAECEFVLTDLQGAEDRLEKLGARAKSLTDRAAVIVVQTNLYTAMADRSDRAIEICLEYLRLVGIDGWSAHPSPEEVQQEYRALMDGIGTRSIGELLDLPLATDPDVIATAEVLLGMFTPAFNTDRGLVALILCRMGSLGIKHGNSDATSLAYAFLGMLLGSAFGDYRTGALFGELARDLVEVRGLERYRGRIYHSLGHHVLPWTQPIGTAIAALRHGLQVMREGGDVTYVSFSLIGITSLLLGSGENLERLQRESEADLALVREGKFELAVDACIGHLRLIHALRGLLPDPCTLETIDRRFFSDHTASWYWIRAMQACFIFGDFTSALVAARRALPFIATWSGFFELPEYHFFSCLVRAACFDDASEEDRAEHRVELAVHREKLATLAGYCAETFGSRVALVDAEIARIEGRPLDAMDAYELAIRDARENGFVQNEAIAFEVAARFYAARKFPAIADAYLEKARACYRRWGADGKVSQLERLHSGLVPEIPSSRGRSAESQLENIDLATVVKTSQAVSLQVGVERLIESLMEIVLQHAGAERGLLLLRRTDGLWIEAEATTIPTGVSVLLRHRAVAGSSLAESMIQYAVRSRQTVLLDDAKASHQFSSDPYLAQSECRSVLCLPLVKQSEVIGVLYLENRLASHVFTPSRVEVLKLLASQAAISLENASLEEKEALLKEVHHRVKNNLQLISSMLSLQASRIKDPAVAELFADSRNRVRSMALVHENLYRAGNFSKIPMASHIQALCAQLTRAYGAADQSVELAVDVGDLQLDVNRAVTCGLIVNELVSNALKHAFPNGRSGRIRVEVEAQGEGRHVLRVSDDGIGMPASFDVDRAESLGLQLVQDLTYQLRGTMSTSHEGGSTFSIAFDEATSTSRT